MIAGVERQTTTETLSAVNDGGGSPGLIVGPSGREDLEESIRAFVDIQDSITNLNKQRKQLTGELDVQIKSLRERKGTYEQQIVESLAKLPSHIRGIALDDGRIFTTRARKKKQRRSIKDKTQSICSFLQDYGIEVDDASIGRDILDVIDGPITLHQKLVLSKQRQ